MPKRTDISSTQPSHPVGGEGRRACAGERGLFRQIRILPKLDQDCAQDAIEIGHHIRVAETKNTKSSRFKKGRSRRVVTFGEGVRVSVDFDNQSFGWCSKVGDVGIDNVLPLELHTQTPRTQRMPECLFRRRHIRSKRFGAFARCYVSLHTPSPNPLPQMGERAIGSAL